MVYVYNWWYGTIGYFRKAHRKVPKFPEGKKLFLLIMADTREIEYTLVPKYQSEIRSVENTSIFVTERQLAELMLMLLYVVKLAEGTSVGQRI